MLSLSLFATGCATDATPGDDLVVAYDTGEVRIRIDEWRVAHDGDVTSVGAMLFTDSLGAFRFEAIDRRGERTEIVVSDGLGFRHAIEVDASELNIDFHRGLDRRQASFGGGVAFETMLADRTAGDASRDGESRNPWGAFPVHRVATAVLEKASVETGAISPELLSVANEAFERSHDPALFPPRPEWDEWLAIIDAREQLRRLRDGDSLDATLRSGLCTNATSASGTLGTGTAVVKAADFDITCDAGSFAVTALCKPGFGLQAIGPGRISATGNVTEGSSACPSDHKYGTFSIGGSNGVQPAQAGSCDPGDGGNDKAVAPGCSVKIGNNFIGATVKGPEQTFAATGAQVAIEASGSACYQFGFFGTSVYSSQMYGEGSAMLLQDRCSAPPRRFKKPQPCAFECVEDPNGAYTDQVACANDVPPECSGGGGGGGGGGWGGGGCFSDFDCGIVERCCPDPYDPFASSCASVCPTAG